MKINLESFKGQLENYYILLVTSNSLEKDAVNQILSQPTKVDLKLKCRGCYIGLVGSHIAIHISGTSGISSEESVGRIVTEFISDSSLPKPKIALLLGFCWGNPTTTKPEQIIVCNTIYGLNSRVVEDDKIKFKNQIFQSALINEYSNCLNGSMVSLEDLITNKLYRDNITNQYPTILGGEMEAFGFIPSLASRKIPWLIIKTVSDFADSSFVRSSQEKAARSSAVFASQIIDEIVSEIGDNENSKELSHLKNILRGKKIVVKATEFTQETLNDYLNDTIGPVIESKLQEYFYMTDQTGDSIFVRYFCDLLLEICQNSFKHGKSTEFEIHFQAKTITLIDDGIIYDVSKITGNRGGASAWNKVDKHFIRKDLVRYVNLKPNIYKFHLEEVKDFLSNLREKCNVTIRPSSIGGSISSRFQILQYDDKCTSVYLKDKHNRMTSRRLSIVEEVRKLLSKNITVYVSVHDEHEASEYLDKLAEFGDKLIILYD